MNNTQEILYIVLSVAAAWITVFLCWALYELAILLRRSNTIVADVQQRILDTENALGALKDKLVNPLTYLGLLAGGGEKVLSMMKHRESKKSGKSSKRGKKSDLYEEE